MLQHILWQGLAGFRTFEVSSMASLKYTHGVPADAAKGQDMHGPESLLCCCMCAAMCRICSLKLDFKDKAAMQAFGELPKALVAKGKVRLKLRSLWE
jgi:hypothetical protein